MSKKALAAQARRILAECMIIDTETNWEDNINDVVIEFAAIDGATGIEALNHLLHTDAPISQRATALHGINAESLSEAGVPQTLLAEFIGRLNDEGYKIASFNLRFDVWALENTLSPIPGGRVCDTYDARVSPLFDQENDIMELANRYFIDKAEWCIKGSKFKRLGQAKCCELAGITYTGQAHRAVHDARAAHELLKFMAEER